MGFVVGFVLLGAFFGGVIYAINQNSSSNDEIECKVTSPGPY